VHVIVSYRIFWINKSENQDADSDTWSLENCAHEVGSSALYNRLVFGLQHLHNIHSGQLFMLCCFIGCWPLLATKSATSTRLYTTVLHSAIVARSSRIAVHHEYSFQVEHIEHVVIVITATANGKTRIPFFLSWPIYLHPLSFPHRLLSFIQLEYL